MVIAENKPADTTSTDSTLAKSDSAKVISTDPKNPKTYLQNIPLTPEQIAASDAKIADAMYNLGFIYLDGLMDTTKSIQTFENYPSTLSQSQRPAKSILPALQNLYGY